MNSSNRIEKLDPHKTTQHRQRDPEAYLARLAVICEGPTEVGFVSHLLSAKVGDDLAGRGIRLSDGGGNDFCRGLLEEHSRAGFTFAGFADDEGSCKQAWAALKGAMGDLLMQWPDGCTEIHVIRHVPEDKLESLLIDPEDALTQPRINTLVDRLKRSHPDAKFEKHTFKAVQEQAGENLRALIVEAAVGLTPNDMDLQEAKPWKKHPKVWFKSESGGAELAKKMFELGAWPELQKYLDPFVTAVCDKTNVAAQP
jgi:putative ATP-dependent endonuclease of OLD family